MNDEQVFTISLAGSAWLVIAKHLQSGAYYEVAPILEALNAQLLQQLPAPRETESASTLAPLQSDGTEVIRTH